jgi:acetyl-CoA carboxylase biotin carboxyl carrier protein
MTNKDPDLKKIQDLIKIMKKNSLVELEIKHGDDKIFLKRAQESNSAASVTAVPVIPHSVPIAHAPVETVKQESVVPPEEKDLNLFEITSPIVGTFYAKPSPDSENFVEIGSHVESNTIVCILEAMKVMNEIKAEVAGTIVEIMVENGQAVEYGQVLFKVKPD